jgi:hypothetical protein
MNSNKDIIYKSPNNSNKNMSPVNNRNISPINE